MKFKPKPSTESEYEQFQLTKQQLIESFPLHKLILSGHFEPINLATYTDPYHFVASKTANHEFIKQDVCKAIKYGSGFEISQQQFLPSEFTKILWALSQVPEYAKHIQDAQQKFNPTIPREKQWLRFGGSSVWLPYLNVHYMVSRILWTPDGIPNKAFVSFLYVQLFDENWHELPPQSLKLPFEEKISGSLLNTDGSVTDHVLKTKVNFREMEFPSFLPIQVEVLYDTDNNQYYWGPEDPKVLARTNGLGFEEPIIFFNMKSVKLQKRVMHLYLPFSNEIRVLKKRNEAWANIEKHWTPFIATKRVRDKAKPKTNSGDEENTIRESDDHVNFIYSFEPLQILTCGIDTGICDFLQKPEKEEGLDESVSSLIGSTPLVRLPFSELIPDHVKGEFELPANRQAYVGWGRTTLENCGCGDSMTRPNLIVLVEDYHPSTRSLYYKIADVSEAFDFKAEVPAWIDFETDEDNFILPADRDVCKGRNVLTPNSIAYWDVHAIHKNKVSYQRKFFDNIPTDHQLDDQSAMKVTKVENSFKRSQRPFIDLNKRIDGPSKYPVFFDDFMGVTLSAADSDVSIVHVRGLLNYILNLPGLFEEGTVIQDVSSLQLRGHSFNKECAIDDSIQYCSLYESKHGGAGPAHRGIFKDEKERAKIKEEQKENREKEQKEKEQKEQEEREQEEKEKEEKKKQGEEKESEEKEGEDKNNEAKEKGVVREETSD